MRCIPLFSKKYWLLFSSSLSHHEPLTSWGPPKATTLLGHRPWLEGRGDSPEDQAPTPHVQMSYFVLLSYSLP